MEARIGFTNLEDSKVASNDALLELVRVAPAEAMKTKLIEVIQKNGLTWNQRTLVENVVEPVVLESVRLGGPGPVVDLSFPVDERDQT